MIKNTIVLHNGYAEIIVESKTYKRSTLLDIEDLAKVGKVRISNTGYAYQCCQNAKTVASVVMNFETTANMVIDHINANRADNRKCNLRIVTQQQNTQARKTFSRNNTGVIGISYIERGGYKAYRVTLTNPKTLKRFDKAFNINKLGKESAFLKAQECLAEMKIQFNYLV